jgi:hypothetical protein
MNKIKLCTYALCGLSLVYAHAAAAQDGSSCEQRLSDLREYFSAKYIALDAQCTVTRCDGNCEVKPEPEPSRSDSSASPDIAPPEASEGEGDGTGSGSSDGSVNVCGSPLSPECAAGYDALNTEVSTAWDKLYAECPEFANPVPVNGVGAGDSPGNTFDTTGPVFRAPTSSELYDTVKTLKKKLSRAKKSLRRERASAKQCRSSRRSR